jgi:asparagine synthase (glutamine-hydrolysing)
MCGVAGIINPEGFDPYTLMSMTHLVSHRGPDGFGFAYVGRNPQTPVEIIHNENSLPSFLRPVIGLGSRRLAIVDLSPQGNMPMKSSDGACCLTYNGEIYNYRELRVELERKGHRFRAETDTEVILNAYLEWKEDCLGHFNGMWSFALWDQRIQRLFCARDRFGVKPFYYTLFDGCFYFGSEIKQILHASGMPRVANARTVYHFLDRGLIDHSPETFFEDVRQLPGGHCLTLELSASLSPVVQRYWELPLEPLKRRSDMDSIEEFRSRFETAVRLRLRSDVPVGSCLSGGLDSSAVICEAQRVAPDRRFQTFSACFEEPALDERDFISAVVKVTNGAVHWTFPKQEGFWQNIEAFLYHQDEPVPSTNVYAQWCVMEEAKKQGIPVLLGGQGADELLCGYQKYRYFYLWHLFRARDSRFVHESSRWLRNGTRSWWTISDASNYFPPLLRRTFSSIKRLCPSQFEKELREPQLKLGAGKSLADRQKTDVMYTSLPALLHYEDRNSMAHSIETRLPFLDYQLAEFAINCPPDLKMRDGWSKWVLRQAVAGTLPEKVRLRKTKLGFDTPQAAWMRFGMQNGHRDLWDSPVLQMERFLSPEKLARESLRFLQGESGALPAGPLFRAMCLEQWARVHHVS